MHAVLFCLDTSKYVIDNDFYEGKPLPDRHELTKICPSQEYAEDYRNECLADQFMQRKEQRAADHCFEE